MSHRAAHSRDPLAHPATLAELYYLINNDSGEIDKIGIPMAGYAFRLRSSSYAGRVG
jgi:hypothetical protein